MMHQGRVATWDDAASEQGAVINQRLGPLARSLGENLGKGRVYLPAVDQHNDRFILLTGQPPSRFLDANASDWRVLKTEPWRAREFGATTIVKVGDADPLRFVESVKTTDARLCLVLPGNNAVPQVQIYTLTDSCPIGKLPPEPAPRPAADSDLALDQ